MAKGTALKKFGPTIAVYLQDIIGFEFVVEPMSCEEIAEAEHLSSLLIAVKDKAKEIEEYRFSITRPIDVEKKDVMDEFRPLTTKLGQVEIMIKGKLTAYYEKVHAEKQRKLDAAAKAGDTEAMSKVAEPAPKTAGVRMREVTKWEVVDDAKLPEEFWMSIHDKHAIDEAVKAGRKPAGVRIWKETVVSAGRTL